MLPSGTHLTAESTEAMRIKCHAQGYIILTQPGFEPSTAVIRKRHLTNMTIMLRYNVLINFAVIEYLANTGSIETIY